MTLHQANYTTMLIDKRDNGVAMVTLNRPQRLNAINATMHREMASFTRDADADTDVRVLLLSGAGRAFCAGGDFSDDAGEEGAAGFSLVEARQIIDHLLELRKPIVCAVQGYAMGLGATLSLLCDVVVAGHSTVIADTHVKMGIGAGDGGQLIWPLLMGVNRAKWFLMSGERITGEALMEMGLINFLVEDEQIMAKAKACADQLAAGPAAAISASKVPVNAYIRGLANQIMPLSLALEEQTMHSPDAEEAQRAFAEKREPQFGKQ